MLLTIAFALGFLLGWTRATRAGGDRLDKLQYGAVHGIALTLGVFIGWIILVRMGWFG